LPNVTRNVTPWMPSKQLPYYEVNGHRYPRVTSILSILRDPDLEKWQAEIGETRAAAKRRHAERIGTMLDKLIKQEIEGKTVILSAQGSSEVRQGWKAWQEYRRCYPGLLRLGTTLVHPTYRYGGTPDILSGNIVIDIKATARLREKFWIQLHAYVPLLFLESVWPLITLRVVRLDTFLGTCEVKDRPFDKQIWETFMHLKSVYCHWFQPQEEAHVSAA